MTLYLILASGMKEEDADAFTVWLEKEAGVEWWHWLDNTWMVADNSEERDRLFWHRQVTERMPDSHSLILVLHDRVALVARLPDEAADWLAKHWDPTIREMTDQEERRLLK